jgi:hypothetical protein
LRWALAPVEVPSPRAVSRWAMQCGTGARIDLLRDITDQLADQRRGRLDVLEGDVDAGGAHQLLHLGLLLRQGDRHDGARGSGAGGAA